MILQSLTAGFIVDLKSPPLLKKATMSMAPLSKQRIQVALSMTTTPAIVQTKLVDTHSHCKTPKEAILYAKEAQAVGSQYCA